MPTNPTPHTQALIAAEAARIMGWTVVDNLSDGDAAWVESPECLWFEPFRDANQAILLADHLERERMIDRWERVPTFADDGKLDYPEVAVYLNTDTPGLYNGTNCFPVEVTPTCPFPFALTLAVSRAVPALAAILREEARDE